MAEEEAVALAEVAALVAEAAVAEAEAGEIAEEVAMETPDQRAGMDK